MTTNDLADFMDAPWGKSSMHPCYKDSFLNISNPAPAYASGEVVLASVYRSLGFEKVSEQSVAGSGRVFLKSMRKGRLGEGSVGTGIPAEVWRNIVTNNLKSPKQPQQTRKQFLQIIPLVPDATIYSQAARLKGSPWNPGELVDVLIDYGCACEDEAFSVKKKLFDALSVGERDDIWAQFLQEEFESWRKPAKDIKWEQCKSKEKRLLQITRCHEGKTSFPAQQFVQDLKQVIDLKDSLTRRQWITMLESLLRIGTAAHVMWLCSANKVSLDLIRQSLKGDLHSQDDVDRLLSCSSFLRLDDLAVSTIKQLSIDYIKARAGINLLLTLLDDQGLVPPDQSSCLGNSREIHAFTDFLCRNREQIDQDRYQTCLRKVFTDNPSEASGRKGIASNIQEFLRHVLGQRQTLERGLDSYDQGFFLKKKASYSRAPWIVSLGSVSVLTIVHALSGGSKSPQTVADLCSHLSAYGIEIAVADVTSSGLGQMLRDLGLVLDSPDAEGGMVIVSPFSMLKEKENDSSN